MSMQKGEFEKKGIDSGNLAFSAKVGFTSKSDYREKTMP